MYLGGIQVDCPQNRDFINSLGVKVAAIPWPQPYRDSVLDRCTIHGGPVWLGPELQQMKKTLGAYAQIVCLTCAAIMSKTLDVELEIMPLSKKRQERGQ